MRSNDELRALAWRRLWSGRWFGRLFGGGLLLGLCGYAVDVVIGGILGRLGVMDWSTYCRDCAERYAGKAAAIPELTGGFILQTTSATILQMFIGYIMSGIAAYGTAVILLRCLRDDERGWLGSAFGGFRDPFGMLWLFLRGMLIYLGWMLVALLPLGAAMGACAPFVSPLLSSASLPAALALSAALALGLGLALAIYSIPFYRYRFLFLVKAEHPDWGAGKCLRECRALTEGHKMESFRLDCSYWRPITLALLALLAVAVAIALAVAAKDSVLLVAILSVVALVAFLGFFALVIVLGQCIGVGQGFFYEDLKTVQSTTSQSERN